MHKLQSYTFPMGVRDFQEYTTILRLGIMCCPVLTEWPEMPDVTQGFSFVVGLFPDYAVTLRA